MLIVFGVVTFVTISQSGGVNRGFKLKLPAHSDRLDWLKLPIDKIVRIRPIPNVLFVTDKRFLSFSIDSSQIQRGFINPSLKNAKLRRAVSHLGGGYLRLGGTAADLLEFRAVSHVSPKKQLPTDGGECIYDNQQCLYVDNKGPKGVIMTGADWIEINEFAKAVGLKLLFDLNVLLRINDTWDSSNAENLLDYSFAHHYNVDWQLGNEPNVFKNTFGVEVSPTSLAADFGTLRHLLQQYSYYNTSLVVGPDISRPRDLFMPATGYLQEFLNAGALVDAVTWHHYYTGPNATLQDFLKPDLYDSFKHSCLVIFNVVKKSRARRKPIWLGETGSAYGGGVANLSDAFVSSLLWTDKLGLAAREGISLIIRQSLYRNHYALLDEHTLDPNPDYWISILYKKLVNNKVLNVTYDQDISDQTLRVYAHCSTKGTIVIFGVNIGNLTYGLNFRMNTTSKLYSLRGTPDLSHRNVVLNGVRLSLTREGQLPVFQPILVSLMKPVPVPSYSVFFLQIYLNLTVC
ncbi:hypothetical protein AAG570_010715 [Ranatra chinensis]|uniref:Heparanase n=1 Tax=Ranatra chinensis TaxID=642074 RepID=A0ABD0Z5F5_9HEMI